MPCYHPMIAIDIGARTEDGKINYLVRPCPDGLRPGDHTHVRFEDFFLYRDFMKCRRIVPSTSGYPFITIPCGKCVGCRMEYSRQWANRCMLELQYHESAYFVTLTYNDYFAPVSYYPDPETGEAQPVFTLRLRDLQLFMKRLRFKFSDQKIRYFACGEYGPTTFRPHYHLILFGLKLPDLRPVQDQSGNILRPKRGYQYYESRMLEDVWSYAVETAPLIPGLPSSPSGKMKIGNVTITDVTWETCAYTARYIMKKLKGPEAKFYSDFSLDPPFVVMSRSPGIARRWYDEHPGCMETDYINIKTADGGKKFHPPHYFDKIYDCECPVESARAKEIRQRLCTESIKAKLERSTMSYLEYMELEERNFKSRIKSLKREDV